MLLVNYPLNPLKRQRGAEAETEAAAHRLAALVREIYPADIGKSSLSRQDNVMLLSHVRRTEQR